MNKRHLQSGASLPLIIALSLILVIVGAAIIWYLLIYSGSKQVSNAADAGALNVAKVALTTPYVTLSEVSPAAAQYFTGLGSGPNHDQINLSNINSVSGAALLAGLNYEAMANPSSGPSAFASGTTQSKTAQTNADAMAQAAFDVSQALKTKLSSSPELQTAFTTFAQNNYPNANVKLNTLTVEYADSGSASNFEVTSGQMPENLPASVSALIPPGQPLPGYKDINIDSSDKNLTYCFVPLSGKPHLVGSTRPSNSPPSAASYESNTLVPNVFHSNAQLTVNNTNGNSTQVITVDSYAEVATTQAPNTGVIPGFIRISNYPGFQPQGGALQVIPLEPQKTPATPAIPVGGMEAMEYANMQMLYGRSNSQGPLNSNDPVVQLMNSPVAVILDPNNPNHPPVSTADGSTYVWGMQVNIQDTFNNYLSSYVGNPSPGSPASALPDPQPVPNMGGGNLWECLNVPLPNSLVQAPTGTPPTCDPSILAGYLQPSNCYTVSEANIGLQPVDQVANAWFTQNVDSQGPHDDLTTCYGSLAHPHIWSVGPPVNYGQNVTMVQYDNTWGASNGLNNSLSFGGAPMVWQYLDNIQTSAKGQRAKPQLFSGMMMTSSTSPRPFGALSANNPVRFATVATVCQILFPDAVSGSSWQGTGWSARNMAAQNSNGSFATQYNSELGLYHNTANTESGDGYTLMHRILTRIHQMNGAFANYTEAQLLSDLQNPPGGNTQADPPLPMGQHAFLYAATTSQGKSYVAIATDGPSGNMSGFPSNFTATATNDGEEIGECLDTNTQNSRSSDAFNTDNNTVAYLGPRYPNTEGLYNVAGDWGFQQPFTNQQLQNSALSVKADATDPRWWAFYVLTPCTGTSGGLMADLSAREFFNQPDSIGGYNPSNAANAAQAGLPPPCADPLTSASAAFSSPYHGSRPIDCPGECFPSLTGGVLPDTSKVRTAYSVGKGALRHAGINGQPHSGGAAAAAAAATGVVCHPLISHGGPC